MVKILRNIFANGIIHLFVLEDNGQRFSFPLVDLKGVTDIKFFTHYQNSHLMGSRFLLLLVLNITIFDSFKNLNLVIAFKVNKRPFQVMPVDVLSSLNVSLHGKKGDRANC